MCEHLSISESAQALMEPPKAMPCIRGIRGWSPFGRLG